MFWTSRYKLVVLGWGVLGTWKLCHFRDQTETVQILYAIYHLPGHYRWALLSALSLVKLGMSPIKICIQTEAPSEHGPDKKKQELAFVLVHSLQPVRQPSCIHSALSWQCRNRNEGAAEKGISQAQLSPQSCYVYLPPTKRTFVVSYRYNIEGIATLWWRHKAAENTLIFLGC